MTADDEYFRYNRENVPLLIQMQLSKKQKTFCEVFIAFLESTLNFEHFAKESKLIAEVFLKLLTPKDVATETHKRCCFLKPFPCQRGNESLKLLKSAEKHFCPTFPSFGHLNIQRYIH